MGLSNVLRVVTVGLLLCASTRTARAEPLIEFEFGGVFTQTTGSVHQVGAPFTVTLLFDAESPDINPLPTRGRYGYLSLTAPYNTSTPIVLIPPSGTIEVFADAEDTHGWQVNYFGASQFAFTVSASFPNGTFASDALPLTLDLSQATSSRFEANVASIGLALRGTIDSLTVRVVPEPSLALLPCITLLTLGRRFRQRRRG